MKKSESKYFNTAKKMDMALLELLQSKPFEYITVSELCKAAGVHRSTFYLHYENTCDLLEETAQGIMEDFQSYFSEETVRMAERLRHCEPEELHFVCDTYLIPYLTFMKDNRTVILTAVKHGKSFGLDKMYERLFTHVFNPVLERFHYPKADRNYVMQYYLNGIHAISVTWLKEGCKRPEEEITNIIMTCVYGRNQTSLS